MHVHVISLSQKKLNIKLPYDPTIPLLGIDPKELKPGTQTETHMSMFTAAKKMEITQEFTNR